MRMSHADGDDQSMSCRDTSTVPPHVSFTNGTGSIFIAWDDNAVFSPACFPTAYMARNLWPRKRRTRNVAWGFAPPRDTISGRWASIRLTTPPTTGVGSSPGVSAVVWSARAS